jgi:hypothetical protein
MGLVEQFLQPAIPANSMGSTNLKKLSLASCALPYSWFASRN